MKPARHDWILVRGDDWAEEIILQEDGSPKDLSGYVPLVSFEWDGTEVALTDGDGLAFEPAAGRVVMSLPGETTGTMPLGRLVRWEYGLTGPDGKYQTWVQGFTEVIYQVREL